MSDPIDTDPPRNEGDEEVATDEGGEQSHLYPKLDQGPACAKDYDPCFLHNCTSNRLRKIAAAYKEVNGRLPKTMLFQAIFDAMSSDQDCSVCPGGACDPLTHVFNPTEFPPPGMVMGPNGVHILPATTPASTAAPTPPTTSSLQQQQQVLSRALSTLEPSLVYRQAGSPNQTLLRPTGSPDTPIRTTDTPFIQGVSQGGPDQINVAQSVVHGAAALATVPDEFCPDAPGTSASTHLDFQADLDRMQREADERSRRRQQEALEAEQQAQARTQQQLLANQQRLVQQEAYEQKKRSIQAAQEAEERAHQLRMQQIRSGMSALPHTAQATPQPTPAPAFSFTAATPPGAPSSLHTPAQLGAGLTTVSSAHRPRSVSFAGTPSFTPLSQVSSLAPSQPPQCNPSIEALIDQRLQALMQQTNNPLIHNHYGGSLPQLTGERGKALSSSVDNPEMAARLGVFAQPTFRVDGNLENCGDLSKLRKILTPGHDAAGAGLVLRQTRWPHQLLQPSVPGFLTVKHKEMSFHQLMNGTVSKLLIETPKQDMSLELSNKLSFLQFIIEMSFKYDHKEVLDITFETYMSWQNRQFNWDEPWSNIEERLKGIRGRFNQVHQPHTVGLPGGNKGPGRHGAGGGGATPGAPQQKQFKDIPINGVPRSFMKEKHICIKFNSEKGCDEAPGHKNRYGSDTLQHFCAGCFAKDQSKEAHKVFDCKRHKFATLFPKW